MGQQFEAKIIKYITFLILFSYIFDNVVLLPVYIYIYTKYDCWFCRGFKFGFCAEKSKVEIPL